MINPSQHNMNIQINELINVNLANNIESLLFELSKGRLNNSLSWVYLDDNVTEKGYKYRLFSNNKTLAHYKNLKDVVKGLKDLIKFKDFTEDELNIKYKHIALTLDHDDLTDILDLADLDKDKISFNVEKEIMEIVKHFLSSDEFKLRFAVTIAKQIKLIHKINTPKLKQIGEKEKNENIIRD